jgi:hypothetical protein
MSRGPSAARSATAPPAIVRPVSGRSAAVATPSAAPAAVVENATEASSGLGSVVLGRAGHEGKHGVFDGVARGVFEAPRHGTVVLVSAVGSAEGSRGAAAALSCAGSGVEAAALLVDAGGRAPRPTLIASASAHRLEERLAARLPTLRPAARGEVCHLSVTADEDGLAAAGTAATVARGGLAVVHVAPEALQPLLDTPGSLRPDAVLLRADLTADRPLVALAVDDLLRRGLRVAVLKHRLGWVAERRAGFGALGSDSGGLPESLVARLLGRGPRG